MLLPYSKPWLWLKSAFRKQWFRTRHFAETDWCQWRQGLSLVRFDNDYCYQTKFSQLSHHIMELSVRWGGSKNMDQDAENQNALEVNDSLTGKVVFYEHENKKSLFMKTKTKGCFLWTRKQKVVFMNMKTKSCFLWTWKQKFVFYEHENKKKAYPGNKSVVYCTFHHRTSFWILQNSILVAQWEDHSLAFGLALSPWRQ